MDICGYLCEISTDPSNSLNLASLIPFSYHVHDFKVADFDKDGDLDIAAGIRFDGLEYARNDGNGSWSVSSIDGTYSWRVQVADFDQDGNLDILDGVDSTDGIKIFYGDGKGGFEQGTAPIFGSRGFVINVIDLNNDNRLDIIGIKEADAPATIGGGSSNELKAFLNLGDRSWSASVGPSMPISEYPFRNIAEGNVSAGDIDKNGYTDQIAVRWDQTDPDAIYDVFLIKGDSSNGNLIWMPQLLDTIPLGPVTATGFADFNEDGNLDVYVGGPTNPNLYIYLGDGQGNFTKETITLNAPGPDFHNLDIGDINGDGRMDIVTGSGNINKNNPNGFQVLYQLAPPEPIFGTQRDDVLTGTNRDDTIKGFAGNDAVQGLAGNDTIDGSNGNDILSGGEESDIINGGNGKDLLKGEQGNDRLNGGNGSDTLVGGAGNDTLIGGNGRDVLIGGLGDDIFTGNNGPDTFVLTKGERADIINDFSQGPDILGLAGGLDFADLSFSGNDIILTSTSEILAKLIGVDTVTLNNFDFATV